MTELAIDFFMSGFIGGLIGASIIVLMFYYYLKSLYIQYEAAKDHVFDIVRLNKLEKAVQELQLDVQDINLELYQKDGYK